MSNILTIDGIPFYMRAINETTVAINKNPAKLEDIDCLVYTLEQLKNGNNYEAVANFLKESYV